MIAPTGFSAADSRAIPLRSAPVFSVKSMKPLPSVLATSLLPLALADLLELFQRDPPPHSALPF
jgi:hypothetical protein